MAIERSSFERTMGIFNALTSILFVYGEIRLLAVFCVVYNAAAACMV
jgi:hypothetical protein